MTENILFSGIDLRAATFGRERGLTVLNEEKGERLIQRPKVG